MSKKVAKGRKKAKVGAKAAPAKRASAAKPGGRSPNTAVIGGVTIKLATPVKRPRNAQAIKEAVRAVYGARR